MLWAAQAERLPMHSFILDMQSKGFDGHLYQPHFALRHTPREPTPFEL